MHENVAQFLTGLGSITSLAMNKYLVLVGRKETGPKKDLIIAKDSRGSMPVLDVVSRIDGSVTFCYANDKY
jgi:hypothetical protein